MNATVIYIDVLIFTNSIINYCILAVVKKYFHIKSNGFRLVLSAFLSSFSSLLIFLPIYSALISIVARLIISATTVFIAFSYKSIRTFIYNVIGFFAVSILFSGFFILVFQVFHPKNMIIVNDTVYFHINPLIVILITIVIYFAVMLFSKIFKEKRENTIVNLKFYINQNKYSCVGKIDTGCNLCEPFSNSPVIVTDKTIVNDIKDFTRVIPYNTIDNSSMLMAVKAEKVIIDENEIEKEIYIAVSERPLSIYKAIINSEIVK